MTQTRPGPDGLTRCAWCVVDAVYVDYHDHEWGRPVADDAALFEMLSLEGFQAGLSWRTILAKRENFRRAFAGFDPERVAAFTEADVARLLQDTGIVRHRGKIEAVIGNARRMPAIRREAGSLAAWAWGFAPDPAPPGTEARSAASVALSKALRRRGWRFVGPTTVHAFMQACGMINDHVDGCATRPAVMAAQAAFERPGTQLR